MYGALMATLVLVLFSIAGDVHTVQGARTPAMAGTHSLIPPAWSSSLWAM